MDKQEFIEKFGMTPEEYGQKYGTLEDPNQGKGATLREKTVDATANFLQGLGSDQYTAYKRARDIFGNPNADLSESIGIMDFTPAQLPFAIQEGKRALQRGDTAEGLFDLGFAGVEMFPAAKLATTPVKSFLKSLASKIKGSPNNLGALENITKDIPKENIAKSKWEETGYPSNMKEEDKAFVIQRMMELANEPNNPYLSGDTGLPMLFKEKYGMSR